MDFTATANGQLNDGTMGMMAGMLYAYLLVLAVVAILLVVATWRIYTKAGEAGWKSLIPIYNTYINYKLFWKPLYFWLMLLAAVVSPALQVATTTANPDTNGPVVLICGLLSLALMLFVGIITILLSLKESKCFGHGVGFGIGLILLPPVFTLILAFGSSEYVGNPDA